MKSQILSIKLANPSFGYKRIGKLVGCSPNLVKFHLLEATRKDVYVRRNSARASAKIELRLALGGKCCVCDYARSFSALDFHHVFADDKCSEVIVLLKTKGFAAARKEAEKCILVCSNCHREIHDGTILVVTE